MDVATNVLSWAESLLHWGKSHWWGDPRIDEVEQTHAVLSVGTEVVHENQRVGFPLLQLSCWDLLIMNSQLAQIVVKSKPARQIFELDCMLVRTLRVLYFRQLDNEDVLSIGVDSHIDLELAEISIKVRRVVEWRQRRNGDLDVHEGIFVLQPDLSIGHIHVDAHCIGVVHPLHELFAVRQDVDPVIPVLREDLESSGDVNYLVDFVVVDGAVLTGHVAGEPLGDVKLEISVFPCLHYHPQVLIVVEEVLIDKLFLWRRCFPFVVYWLS